MDYHLSRPDGNPFPQDLPYPPVPGFVPDLEEATQMIETIMAQYSEYQLAGDDDAKMRAYLTQIFEEFYLAPELKAEAFDWMRMSFVFHLTCFMFPGLVDDFKPWELEEGADEEEGDEDEEGGDEEEEEGDKDEEEGDKYEDEHKV